jgi:hypothetical protein
MPDGQLYHIDCIHQYPEDFHVERMPGKHTEVIFGNGSSVSHTPCPHKPRAIAAKSGYYSDWSVYAQSAHPSIGNMYSEWSVPGVPKSHGPAPPLVASAVYFFNGLEDGGGHHGNATLILQPVLQYGKSGCLLNPTKHKDWYLTSYLVNGNGRAYCGKNLGPLKTGERLSGEMKLQPGGNNTWKVLSTRMSTGEVSTQTTSLGEAIINAAYLTLEGMVIYSCEAYPPQGKLQFSNNSLADASGAKLTPKWVSEKRHSECKQDVSVDSDGSVTLEWNPAA